MAGIETYIYGEVSNSPEIEDMQTFGISVGTLNAGNGKRGTEVLRQAMERMVALSSPGAGIIGFQEIPLDSAEALENSLPSTWSIHSHPNPTDPDLSMAVAYDLSKLELQEEPKKVVLPPLPRWLQFFQFPRRETPLEREAHIFHFTRREDPDTHVVLVNGHLSVLGFLKQRKIEVDAIMAELCIFLHNQGLVNAQTDEAFPGQRVSVYFIGDFNTPGRVGSKRNEKQIRGLQLFEKGFVKLNDRLEATSNALSSALHKAHDIKEEAFEVAENIRDSIRRSPFQRKLLEVALSLAAQHRDHIFNKLYGLEHKQEVEQTIFAPSEHPMASDHYLVLTGSALQKVS